MEVKNKIPLKRYSYFRKGGKADFLVKVKNREDLVKLKFFLENSKIKKYFVLGGGTNVLFPDEGFRGVIIKPEFNFIGGNQRGEKYYLRAGAGVLISDILDFCVKNNLKGLEWAGGLPGTLGGAIKGNAGAFGGEIKDNIREAASFNIKSGKFSIWNNRKCGFGYRTSVFKEKMPEEIIVEAEFELKRGEREIIKRGIAEKIKYRKDRQPLSYPNLGSIFKNFPLGRAPRETAAKFKGVIKVDPFPVIPTAALIDAAGLKGFRVGGVRVASKHPNFIVNFNKGKSEEAKKLIKIIKEKILKRFKIKLEEEIKILN